MTDIVDFKIETLQAIVFDKHNNVNKSEHYYDIVSLISLLTSPTEIDYQLIADFFLTYRSFISQKSLLEILLLRIQWCIDSIDDAAHEMRQSLGKLTLVRTFVMIRHWLLNYFTEDFIASQDLRALFIQGINSLKHNELFVQRIIGSLKQSWTNCCNKSWDEKIECDDFYTFEVKIGPQGNRHKRLSLFALNQQNNPVTRNSMVLLAFEKNVIHKLPIPIQNKRDHKIVLNLQNSSHKLGKTRSSTNAPDNSSPGPTEKVRPTLYTSLSSASLETSRSTIRDSTEFIKSPTLSRLLPPTPVKKMEFMIHLPSTTKPQHKGLRPLVESWLKTFHLHQGSKFKQHKRAETFMKSVVSVAKVDNSTLEELASGKFDILSARTIDELEYLVRFHNQILSKHGTKLGINAVNESFSFAPEDADSITKGSSNIDNMNICETISLISKSVVSLQQLVDGNRKSYISYDSVNSRADINGISEEGGNLKKKGKVANLKEFNFEGDDQQLAHQNLLREQQSKFAHNEDIATGSEKSSDGEVVPKLQEIEGAQGTQTARKIRESQKIEDNDTQSPEEYNVTEGPLMRDVHAVEDDIQNEVHSFNEPDVNEIQMIGQTQLQDFQKSQASASLLRGSISRSPVRADTRTSLQSISQSFISESTPNLADVESNTETDDSTNNTTPEINDSILTDRDKVTQEAEPVDLLINHHPEPTAVQQDLIDADNDIKDVELKDSASVFGLDDQESCSRRTSSSASRFSHEGSDYVDIEPFVSTYEEDPEVEELESGGNETGPNYSDFINEPKTPLHSPSNDGIISSTPQISPIKPISEDTTGSKGPTLDLNRVPSFTRISNSSSLYKGSLGVDRDSYLSKRSIHGHGAREQSMNSIFSGVNLVNVTIEHQDQSPSPDKDAADSVSLYESINSKDYNIPYPGVDSDVMAELAAISDDSYQDDPISAALLKLEGSYKKREQPAKSSPSRISSYDSKELLRSVESLGIHSSPSKRNSVFIDQRRKTKLFSLTPVKQKEVSYKETSSRILLDLLLSRKISDDVLQITNREQHISFILNFNSKIIAEQFTLIEKDALLEIDWKELVELRWDSDKLVPINSWLELLIQNQDIHGVDLCVSRFNLTVNWIISEIILTKDITLRKLTIQRFIHIAQNCKMLQNYSTLMQILLALGSDKIMKLKDTWRIIEPGDILIYKNLEAISSPLKNFIVLRNELNKIKPSLGCVPFLGLYLSDLVFNQEKKSCDGDRINFGKFKHDAKIVRSLIQCIQWSTLYRLKTEDEVLSKCLYIKALTEEEMNVCMETIS